jgi:hypothetical protein
MEYAGLILALIGMLIANVTVVPAFNRKYPTATAWLNIVSSAFNSIGGLIAVLTYKAQGAIALLPSGETPGQFLRRSFIVALIGSVVAECASVVALLLHAGLMRVLAGILLIVGIPTIVRLSIVVMKREDPPRGMAVAG